MNQPLRIIVVGMGARAMIYAREALLHPELFLITGVAVSYTHLPDQQDGSDSETGPGKSL